MIKLYKTTLFLFFLTFNSFAQWAQVSSAPTGYINNIIEINGALYLSCSNSGIYVSYDSALTWQSMNNGLNNSQSKSVNEIIVYNDNFYAATVDGIYKSTDNANNWTKKSSGITIGPGAIYEFTESIFEYNGVLFTGAYNGIYKSTDEAENWQLTNISGENIQAKNFVVHNGIIFAARESINTPYAYKSTDNGSTWETLNEVGFPTLTFFSEPNKLWTGLVGGVELSTDNGLTWEDRSNGLGLDPYGSSIIRVKGDLVTALKFGGSGIFISSDEGLNWSDYGDELPFLNAVFKLFYFNQKIYAVTSDGLWQRNVDLVPVELTNFIAEITDDNNILLKWKTETETNNKGFEIERFALSTLHKNWESIRFVTGNGTTTKPNNYSYMDKGLSNGKYKYKLKQIDYDGTFSYSKQIELNVNKLNDYTLEQNYPNPFNPTTNIGFRIADFGFVSIKVYNILGKEVATLVNEEKQPGNYEVKFDGSKLSSGIYFYKLQAGDFVQTKKITLLK